MTARPALRRSALVATSLAAFALALPHLPDTLAPAWAEVSGDTRDKGEKREKGNNGKGAEARSDRGQGKGRDTGGSSSGSNGGSSSTGSSGGTGTGSGTSGSSTGGGSTTGASTAGGSTTGGSTTGSATSGGSTTGGSTTGGSGGVPAGSGTSGGAAPLPERPVTASDDTPYLSGSSAPRRIAPLLRPDRLAPYADALIRLSAIRSRLAEAQARLARLESLDGAALARAFPSAGETHDSAAHAADLARLDGAGAEWIRLSRLDAAALAREFPPVAAGTPHDAAAHARALRRALLRARDHDTLANLAPERLAQLYPPRPASGPDRAAHRRALDAARDRADALRVQAAQAEIDAQQTLYTLTGGVPLTPREQAWIAAYVAG